jgi:hypothetical protein
MNDKSNDCPVCLKEMEKHTAQGLCACMMKIIKGKPSNYVSPDSAKTEMFEKLNKDLRLKRDSAERMIDKELAYLNKQRTKIRQEGKKELMNDEVEYNYEFDKSITRTIMTLQTIKDELIPKEKP